MLFFFKQKTAYEMVGSDWFRRVLFRSHRIGQTKKVMIYRLITRASYEEVMFETASRKLGLDQARRRAS